jgi:hypothetical protein
MVAIVVPIVGPIVVEAAVAVDCAFELTSERKCDEKHPSSRSRSSSDLERGSREQDRLLISL